MSISQYLAELGLLLAALLDILHRHTLTQKVKRKSNNHPRFKPHIHPTIATHRKGFDLDSAESARRLLSPLLSNQVLLALLVEGAPSLGPGL